MKKFFSLFLTFAMLATIFAACGKTSTSSADTPAQTQESSQTADTASPAQEPDDPSDEPIAADTAPASVEYPLVTDGSVSLRVYMAMAGFIPMVIPDVANVGFDTTRAIQVLEKQTGVDLT